MRGTLTTLVELVGLALMAAGSALVYLPLGLIVLGVCLVLVGYLEGRR